MQYRKTRDGAAVSALGLGCMRFPQTDPADPRSIDEAQVGRMIERAYRAGVNYFDTAYMYHDGASEGAVGRALKRYPRESYFLADKMPGWLVGSPADAERIFAEQLARTGADYFDFYLCHALGREGFGVYEDFLLDLLKRKKAEGKIKRLGFSFHDTPEALRYIADYYDWDFAQLQINYVDWEYQAAGKNYDYLTAKGIPVVVMEPVRGGALARLPERAFAPLKNLDPSRSQASWAIRYVLNLDNVLTVLSGMSDEAQVKDNLATVDTFLPLSAAEKQAYLAARTAFKASNSVPCTACRYCMDCPFGVDIPGNFRLYNEFVSASEMGGEEERRALSGYAGLGAAAASACKTCRKCVEHCPQKIDIPAMLSRVRETLGRL